MDERIVATLVGHNFLEAGAEGWRLVVQERNGGYQDIWAVRDVGGCEQTTNRRNFTENPVAALIKVALDIQSTAYLLPKI